jgi:hypothetical protein
VLRARTGRTGDLCVPNAARFHLRHAPSSYALKYTAFGSFRQGYGAHDSRWFVQFGRLGPRVRILCWSFPFGSIR